MSLLYELCRRIRYDAPVSRTATVAFLDRQTRIMGPLAPATNSTGGGSGWRSGTDRDGIPPGLALRAGSAQSLGVEGHQVTRGDGSGATLGVTLSGSLRFTSNFWKAGSELRRRCFATSWLPFAGPRILLAGFFSRDFFCERPSQLFTRREPDDQGLGSEIRGRAAARCGAAPASPRPRRSAPRWRMLSSPRPASASVAYRSSTTICPTDRPEETRRAGHGGICGLLGA
jgi:hypothetical protein